MASLLVTAFPALSQNTWNNAAGTTNWSDAGNWSFAASPSTFDIVLFDNVTPASPANVIDNIVDNNFTISALTYQTVSTNGFHTTWLNSGVSLNVNGTDGNAISVGSGGILAGAVSVYDRFAGPGTLTITNLTGAINASQGGDNNDHFATLDLSGLTNFSASVGQILVGCIPDISILGTRPMGIIRLADTNFIQTTAGVSKPGILIASYPTGDTNIRGTEQLFLGRHNIISSDAISIGGTKTSGQILSRPGVTSAFASLRGSAGGSEKVKLLVVGDGRGGMANFGPGGTSVANSGAFDGTGTFLDALVQDLYVARSQTNNNGATTGVLTFDQGSITADNLFVGYHPSPSANTGSFNGTGTVNVNGTATLNVNNDLVLTRKLGTNIPVATLNIGSAATVNVNGNVITSGGNSTINFNNGGTLNLQPAGDAAAGYVSVGTLSGSGNIQNAANVTNTTALTPGSTTAIGTLNVANNLTLATGATLNLNLASTTDAGLNDLVNVIGDLNLNNNSISLTPLGNSLANTPYTLITFNGTRSGTFNFNNPTRYNAVLDYQPNQINILFSGSPGSVKWNSAANSAWNLTTSNWQNTATSLTDRFMQLDTVLIDDSVTATNTLILTGTLLPNQVTVSSSARDYIFGGSGKISGPASLIKSGSSTLTLSNANDFAGPVTVNGGVLRVINGSALGNTNGATTIASGATLDVFGSSLFNPGELITIAGTGLSNTGAVINTGAAQNNAIRFLTLSDDATVRVDNRFDVRGPSGSGSFSGSLNLNGFTLTKLGGAQMSLADTITTNAGSIVIGGGILGLTRSQVDGPGFINVLTNVLLFENSSTGYLAKPISVGGGTIRVTGNAVTLGMPITNIAGVTIDNSVTLTLTNTIQGNGGLTKIGAGNLLLNAPATYVGPTLVSVGRLTLSTNATLASSSSIALAAGTSLDVSGMSSGFTLGAGQVLAGSGTIIGDVSADVGSTLIPGGTPGTLTLSNSLTLNAATNVLELGEDPTQIGNNANDLIAVNGNLTLNGVTTLKIAPIGPLSAATPYTVITYTGSLSGGLANLRVISDNPRYSFSIVDPATTPNSIQVAVSGVPTTLVWKGGAPGNATTWNSTIANWLNGLATDTFFAGDNVQFDDTGSSSLVTVAANVQPGAIAINNAANNYAFTGGGTISAGSLTKLGNGALTFGNAANNFATGFEIGSGTVLFTNNGANNFGVSGPVALTSGTITFANGGADNFSGGMTIDNGTMTIANSTSNFFGPNLGLNNGSLVLNQSVDALVGAAITNGLTSGVLLKQGPNTVTLSGNNTNFDGPILVNSGVLKAANAFALGNANGATTIADGATLDINGTSLYNPGDTVIISGAGLSSTGAVINTGAAQNNGLRALVLSNNASIAAWGNRWDVRGPAGAGSLSGLVNLNDFTLSKLGPGINSLVDADITSPGSIEIKGGELHLTRCNVDGSGIINLLNNILVLENYSSGYLNKPLVSGGGTLRVIGNSFSLGVPITNSAGLTVDVASGLMLTSQATIAGPGSFTKITAGTNMLVATDNAWSGSTTITAGTLQIGSGANDGSLPDLPIINNGTLLFSSLNDFTNTHEISGGGILVQTVGGTVYLTASNSFSGQTTINSTVGTSPSGAALRISNGNALGSTAGNTHIVGNTTGNGRLELVGDITVPEPLLVDCRQSGTIDLPAVLNVSGNNVITGAVTGSTGGSDMNFQSDSGKLTMAGSFVCTSTAGTRRLKLMGDANGEWSGNISNSANGAVFTHVVKTGLGTWTLSGLNAYSGTTTVRQGTLAISPAGSISSSPTIDVQDGATLDVSTVAGFTLASGQTLKGNGLVAGALTLGNGSTLSAGAGVGTLTIGQALTCAPGSTNFVEIDKVNGTNDFVKAASITYGGTLVLTEISSTPFVLGDTFKLFEASSYSGSFASVSLPVLDPGLSWDLSLLNSNGTLRVGPSVSSTPVNMTFEITAGTIKLGWPADHTGWNLQAQTNSLGVGLSSNWAVVPGSAGTNQVFMPVDAANGSVFYRLIAP